MKKGIVYIISFLLSFNLQSTNTVDSLENIIANSKDTTKIKAILALVENYQTSNFEKALKHSKEALTLSIKENYTYGIGLSHSYIGYSLTDLGK